MKGLGRTGQVAILRSGKSIRCKRDWKEIRESLGQVCAWPVQGTKGLPLWLEPSGEERPVGAEIRQLKSERWH